MFTAVSNEAFPYSDPWNIPAHKRLAALCARKRRIVYFYSRPDTSTFRYRVFNMVEALDAAPDLEISASWFGLDDLPVYDSFLDRADVLVMCRAWYNSAVNQVVRKAKSRGLRVLFDVDDLVFDSRYTHLILETLDQPIDGEHVWNHWFGVLGRIGETLRLCDSAIVTNQYLADKVSAFAPWIDTRIIPNFLNRKQQSISEQIYAAKQESGFARDKRLVIGYFSGTPTHNRDFEIAARALAEILSNDPEAIVRIVGFLDLPQDLAPYRDHIEFYPLQDFCNLQRLIGQSEINIAPLQTNEFTNCKSELKFFEAAIVGTLTIASPTYTFLQSVRDGETALISGEHEWANKIWHAMQIVRNMGECSQIAESAYTYAVDNYSWHLFGDRIANAVFGPRVSRP